jgi:hypothetical protein
MLYFNSKIIWFKVYTKRLVICWQSMSRVLKWLKIKRCCNPIQRSKILIGTLHSIGVGRQEMQRNRIKTKKIAARICFACKVETISAGIILNCSKSYRRCSLKEEVCILICLLMRIHKIRWLKDRSVLAKKPVPPHIRKGKFIHLSANFKRAITIYP